MNDLYFLQTEAIPDHVSDILKRYSVEILKTPSLDHRFHLTLDRNRLGLVDSHENFAPLSVDFDERWSNWTREFKFKALRREPLFRCLGKGQRVLDATCGLARDALFFLYTGRHVWAFERSPWAAILIEDAIQRAQTPQLQDALRQRFHFTHGDARLCPANLDIDLVYLDPMYSHPNAKALPNKGMQIFRDLVGEDGDAHDLLRWARQRAQERVIVKRPRLAPDLAPEILHRYEGKSTRYDLYSPL